MAYHINRVAAQVERDRRRIEAEEADLLAEAERIRDRRERLERQQQPQQEVLIRIDRRDRSPYDRPRRAEVDVYEPRRRDDRDRDRYGRITEAALRETKLREEEEAYRRGREIARAVVEVREDLRTLPRPRRRSPRPIADLTTGEILYSRREELPMRREPLYTHVPNPRYIEERRRRSREVLFEDVLFEEELGIPMYEDWLLEDARLRREADDFARWMALRREEDLWDGMRRL